MKTKLLLSALFYFYFYLLSSQIPQGFNYQAIARDGSGNPITSTPIQVRLTLQSDSAGTVVIWQELHSSVTTNSFGLFTLVMGRGTRQSGSAVTFDAIDWSITPKFLKTEVNYGGWKDMGTTRLWSVPYSLYARIAGNGFSGNYNDLSNRPVLFDGTWSSLTGKPSFATVATSGNYNDLTNRPTILNSQWTTNGTSIYYNSGNVGIGTNAPTALLNVRTSANYNFGAFYSTPGAASIGAFNDGFSTWQPLSVNPGGQVWFLGGAVGIGTSSPGYPLHVVGTARIQGSLVLDNNLNAGGYSGVGNLGGYSLEIGGPSPSATSGQATIYLHHHGAIAHQLRYTSGTLYFEAAGNGYGTNTTPTFLVGGSLFAAINGGNVGFGTSSSTSKVVIQPPGTWDDNTPLFEVKNKSGITVFAVYNNGVRAFVQTNSGKGVKGGFAIGGFDPSKAGNVDLMTITPDSIRFYIDNGTAKSTKGGFAIGSFNTSKGVNQDFMYLTPQTSGNGQYNTFMGYQSGTQTRSSSIPDYGKWNSFIGYQAGYSNKYGYSNVFIGYHSGFSSYGPSTLGLNGVNNVYIGTQAGEKNLGSNNILMGDDAGKLLTGGYSNVYIGSGSGRTDVNGDYNTYVGAFAGKDETGSDNVMLGYTAGFGSGESNLLVIGNRYNNALISGYFNTKKLFLMADVGIGTTSPASTLHVYPGQVSLTGTTNPYIRFHDGTYQGYIEITSGNLSLTHNGFVRLAVAPGGNIGIGTPTPGYKLTVIGSTWCSLGAWSGSDIRWKKNITGMNGVLENILELRPVNFKWRTADFPEMNFPDNDQIGLIAQEVEKSFPDLVMTDQNGYKSVSYEKLSVILLEGMKEQQNQIDTQLKRIESQNEKIERLEKLVLEMQSTLNKPGVR